MRTENAFRLIVGATRCPVEPEVSFKGLRYPWSHMDPGHYFTIDDPDPAARQRMAAAAASAGRRMGARFATGKLTDELARVVGYWCARYDGCTILDAEDALTKKQRFHRMVADMDARDARIARGQKRAQKVRYEQVRPLGASSGVAGTAEPEDMAAETEAWANAAPAEEGF